MKKEDAVKGDSGHAFADYFKRAVNPLLVMQLLSERTMYVYEMMQQLRIRSDGEYEISLLYPVLYRLVSQGYVREGEKKASQSNHVRQYYEITPAGKAHLAETMQAYDRMLEIVAMIRQSGGEKQK